MSDKVSCHWSTSLDVDCPCGEVFDYLRTDHYSDGGFESLRDVAQSCTVSNVPCPSCGKLLTLDVQDGL